jgi:hypothetical protein
MSQEHYSWWLHVKHTRYRCIDQTSSKTFSCQISTMTDVLTHCLWTTGMSLASTARQIKQLASTNGIISGHHRQVLYMTVHQRLRLLMTVYRWRRPLSSAERKPRPSLLGLFWRRIICWSNFLPSFSVGLNLSPTSHSAKILGYISHGLTCVGFNIL